MTYRLPKWAKDLSDQKLDDAKLAIVLKLPEMKEIRWLDLRFNQITRVGVESLCQTDLPNLEVVELFGNPCDKIGETYQIDSITESIIGNSIKLTSLSVELEAKYGYKRWFHPISEFGDQFPHPNQLEKSDPILIDEETYTEDDNPAMMIWDA